MLYEVITVAILLIAAGWFGWKMMNKNESAVPEINQTEKAVPEKKVQEAPAPETDDKNAAENYIDAQKTNIENADRITSYNVCYTKLLRI